MGISPNVMSLNVAQPCSVPLKALETHGGAVGTVGLQSLRSGILLLHCLDAVWQPSSSGWGLGGGTLSFIRTECRHSNGQPLAPLII